MATHFICPSCGAVELASRQRRYCSNKCRQRAKRRRELGLPLNLPAQRQRDGLRRFAR